MPDVGDVLLPPGTRAAQPAAGIVSPGSLYCVTDEEYRIERSNGVAWEAFSLNTNLDPWIDEPYLAANFTAESGTWTVDAGDVGYCRYIVTGKTLDFRANINTTDVSATPTELRVAAPAGLTLHASESVSALVYSEDGYATQGKFGFAIARDGATKNYFALKPASATWATIVGTTGVKFTIRAELA